MVPSASGSRRSAFGSAGAETAKQPNFNHQPDGPPYRRRGFAPGPQGASPIAGLGNGGFLASKWLSSGSRTAFAAFLQESRSLRRSRHGQRPPRPLGLKSKKDRSARANRDLFLPASC